jgi:hypothetical protein
MLNVFQIEYLSSNLTYQQRSNRFIKESHHVAKTSFYKFLKSFQDIEKSIQMCHAYSYNMI